MINLSEESFKYYKGKNMIFPLVLEMHGDEVTPISIFYSLEGENKFLLESAYRSESLGRYSFIGMNPYMKVTSTGSRVSIIRGMEIQEIEGDVLQVVKAQLKAEFCPLDIKIPYTGGAIGYVGYDVIRQYERIPDENADELKVPESYLMFYKDIICYDHYTHKIHLICNILPQDTITYEEVIKRLRHNYESIRDNVALHHLKAPTGEKKLTSNLTEEQYCRNVEKAKEYIKKGDIFQVVLSQRLTVECESDAFDVYRRLRSRNPSPYLFYIDFGGFELVGSSPESLVSVHGDKVVTNPIAGTRKRGRNDEEDEFLRKELIDDEKERAEHVMLVDLGRNDIGKISEFGTVELGRFMEVDYYSHVMHIVSTVTGKLKKEHDCFDALKSCLPAGTVSGAPKIRAMEIIDELENVRRGIYAGAVGYFSYSGSMDMCIAIRTIVFKDGRACLQAGAGIVHDSVPESEYTETLNKVMALKEVI